MLKPTAAARIIPAMPTEASDVVIATSGLTKRYGDVTAVDNLSLHVRQGEIYAFLGLNGAGKSTTIRMLLGMVRPTVGVAEIFGSRVHPGASPVWSRTGYLVEAPTAYPELTVRENLEAARRLRRTTDRDAVNRIMDRLSLSAYADRRAGTLSQGNLQRLGLAKALLHEPDLLLLDEPANGLDPAGVVEVRELLRDLCHDKGATVLMSSHILAEVDRLAERIGIIHRGRLIEEMTMRDLERQRRTRLLVDARQRDLAKRALTGAGLAVGSDGDGPLELYGSQVVEHPDDIARLLVEAGVPPTMLRVEQEDLESHFLRLVSDGTEGALD